MSTVVFFVCWTAKLVTSTILIDPIDVILPPLHVKFRLNEKYCEGK